METVKNMTSIKNSSTMSESKTNGVHSIVITLNGVHVDGSCECHASDKGHDTKDSPPEKLLTNGSKREPYTPNNLPPPTRFAVKCHPRADEVCSELDDFFSKHWPWENEQAREKFVVSDTNRWACWALPLAKDDRILDATKLLTLFFLLDGKFLYVLHKQRNTETLAMKTLPKTCPSKRAKHFINASSHFPRVNSYPIAQILTNGSPTTRGRVCVQSTRNRRKSPSTVLCYA